MKRLTFVGALIGLVSVMLVGVAAAEPLAPRQLVAPLNGAAEVPSVETDAVGMAVITTIPAAGVVCAEVIVSDSDTIVASHIHQGAAGTNGGVVVSLGAFETHNAVCVEVDPRVAGHIGANPSAFYVNVHTEAFPGGEVRGQLRVPRPGQFYSLGATLTGANEVPAVESDGIGFANVVIHRQTGIVCSVVVADDIEPAFASHVHAGAAGENGPAVISLGAVDGSAFACQVVDNAVINSIIDPPSFEAFYVNVHTDAYPGGELRGQLADVSERDNAIALLTGGAEVPPVDSAGVGLGAVFVDHDAGALCWSLIASGIGEATGAHIHEAPVGENGGVVVFFDPFDGFDAGCQYLDAETLEHLTADWSGFYINIHTEAVPSGELRGQLTAL
ncbi:MAG: CHRD domain-containing protein [Acidimicrobiia bacterium]|nr:CHRD domain-containing protein [Acidimicrobiia bacterium]NNF65330.1 CHRD domain-containing protein [Acidimicrobiia bacterium]